MSFSWLAWQHQSHIVLDYHFQHPQQPCKSLISFHSFCQARFSSSENRSRALNWHELQACLLSLLFLHVTQCLISISLLHIKAFDTVWFHSGAIFHSWEFSSRINFKNLTILASTACNRNPTAVAPSCCGKLEVRSPREVGSLWLYDGSTRPSGTQSQYSSLLCHQRMRFSSYAQTLAATPPDSWLAFKTEEG